MLHISQIAFFWAFLETHNILFNRGISCFIVLHFIVLHNDYIFTNWKFVAILHWANLLVLFFSNSICSLSYLCVTFWEFSKYIRLFHYYYICYGELWLVTFDVTIVIVLELCKLHQYKMTNLINKCVCSDTTTDHPFLCPSHSPRAFLFPETQY